MSSLREEALVSPLSEQWPETLARIRKDLDLSEMPTREAEKLESRILTVWAFSHYTASLLETRPSLLHELIVDDALSRTYARQHLERRLQDDFSTLTPGDEQALARCLRLSRHRELLLIAWRDLNGLAPLDETMLATSDLADCLIGIAHDFLYDKLALLYGTPLDSGGKPQRLVVLGMGKLGGRELNFSSDVDLIFCYPEAGQTDRSKPVDNGVFFTRLGQAMISALHKVTSEGFVYRVDMRLRPFGESGALVTNFDATESYYEAHGRAWERYALLKARPVAGDIPAGELLMKRLNGFIYRRYLDYSMIRQLREMKVMIAEEAVKRGKEADVKLGQGGIREVEFCTQVFQLIGGGRDRHLQQRSLLKALDYIAERGLLEAEKVEALREAYIFLRRAENRLQMLRDQQTQALPHDDLDRWRLHKSMGFDSWEAFYAELQCQRGNVSRQFAATFDSPKCDGGEAAETSLWLRAMAGEAVADALETMGFSHPGRIESLVQGFARDVKDMGVSEPGLERMEQVMPEVLKALVKTEHQEVSAIRVLMVLKAIARRSVYFSLLAEHPQALQQLLRLCDASQWIAEQIASFPLLLDELLNPLERAMPPEREVLAKRLDEQLGRIDPEDEELLLDSLRQFKNRQVLRVAAADILDLFPVMKVSDHLTWIAEVLVDKVAALAWAHSVERYGRPMCEKDGQSREANLGVVAYGKLGSLELGYGSDLDLVFLHDSEGKKQQTEGKRSIANGEFFARLVRRFVSMMTVYTSAGTLYEVDLRLRPSGNAGMLVTTLEGFGQYQREKAWTWEHQALVRARYVAGPKALGERFKAVRRELLMQVRDPDILRREVRQMREKMWNEHAAVSRQWFDLKKSPGGITDIEFMVQYMVLAHAPDHPELCRWTDNIRLLRTLAETEAMDQSCASELEAIYQCLRDELHHRKLKGQTAQVAPEVFAQQLDAVIDCWSRYLGSDTPEIEQ
ncbi:MAG: bifunctional [glutamate--ammonia ligase]-adenylyl-L-tyrosine phosphorylase/[glutamate--ammonia-ligase] adenylyltransferase [bacterium]